MYRNHIRPILWFLLGFALMMLVVPAVFAQGTTVDAVVNISWTPPTTSTDGTPLTDLAGYRLYQSTTPGQYDMAAPVATPGAGALSTQLRQPMESGSTYYWILTAVDTSGNESLPSNEASKLVEAPASGDILPPGEPTIRIDVFVQQ